MPITLEPADSAIQPQAPDIAAQLDAILHGAAVALITDRAFLRVSGPDAARWLNGMVTNSIETLQPGEGNFNFLLSAQGRILGDCTIYREPSAEPKAYLLQTDAAQLETIQLHLDKFIIMDDVELQPMPSNASSLVILGPAAPSVLGSYYRSNRGGDYTKLLPLRLAFHSEVADQITTPPSGLVQQFEIRNASAESLMRYLIDAGVTPVSPEALEALRILSGTPRYGTDIRNTETAHDLPQETAQTRALHFSKGCYLGQEIVERIRSRGNVHRTFSGFELTGTLPEAGTALTAESFPRPVGELTSVAAIPLATGTIQLALGYIRREVLDKKLPVQYPGGTATPSALPFPLG